MWKVQAILLTVIFNILQVAYQVNQFEVAKVACQVLWEYFVSTIPEPASETYFTSAQNDFKLTLYRWEVLAGDSKVPQLHATQSEPLDYLVLIIGERLQSAVADLCVVFESKVYYFQKEPVCSHCSRYSYTTVLSSLYYCR